MNRTALFAILLLVGTLLSAGCVEEERSPTGTEKTITGLLISVLTFPHTYGGYADYTEIFFTNGEHYQFRGNNHGRIYAILKPYENQNVTIVISNFDSLNADIISVTGEP